ncbi:hypothetical protein ACLOJK_041476 [Asimina triloba]
MDDLFTRIPCCGIAEIILIYPGVSDRVLQPFDRAEFISSICWNIKDEVGNRIGSRARPSAALVGWTSLPDEMKTHLIMSDPSRRSGREKAWATTRMASSGINREHLYAGLLPVAARRVLLLPVREPALTRLPLRPDSPPFTGSHHRDPNYHLFRPAIQQRQHITPARSSLDSISDRVLNARFPFHFIPDRVLDARFPFHRFPFQLDFSSTLTAYTLPRQSIN